MLPFVHRQGCGVLVSLAVVAIALNGCGGSSATAAPTSGSSSANSAATDNGGSGLSSAASAFSIRPPIAASRTRS